jgi:hypothetical protein
MVMPTEGTDRFPKELYAWTCYAAGAVLRRLMQYWERDAKRRTVPHGAVDKNFPPCSSTRRLVRASPSPVPSAFRDRSLPNCLNSSKSEA